MCLIVVFIVFIQWTFLLYFLYLLNLVIISNDRLHHTWYRPALLEFYYRPPERDNIVYLYTRTSISIYKHYTYYNTQVFDYWPIYCTP